jgi:hypothetical protein
MTPSEYGRGTIAAGRFLDGNTEVMKLATGQFKVIFKEKMKAVFSDDDTAMKAV